MLLKEINQLKSSKFQAVIINVNTRLVTTLALFSAIKYAGMPILVIDCESSDNSLEHFNNLMKSYKFDLLSAPLRIHGITLDHLFKSIPSETILLIDSDVEILNPNITKLMKDFIEDKSVFGCGFVHGPSWLSDHPNLGYYHERMWIPMTMLKVSYIRQALNAGFSFISKTRYNDFAPSKFISKILALRFRMEATRNWRLPWLNWFKESYYGLKPSYVFCDTGAEIYQFLKYKKGLYYPGFPAELHRQYVNHFHGVTRSILDPADFNSTNIADITEHVKERLQTIYHYKETNE